MAPVEVGDGAEDEVATSTKVSAETLVRKRVSFAANVIGGERTPVSCGRARPQKCLGFGMATTHLDQRLIRRPAVRTIGALARPIGKHGIKVVGESKECGTHASVSAAAQVVESRVPPLCLPLRGVVQHYAWGKSCESTLVGAVAATQHVRSERRASRAPPMDRGLRFAELWMSTHPNGPASVVLPWIDEDGMSEIYLKDLIQAEPDVWLGRDEELDADLPFNFKALSVRQALPIRAHPSKQMAKRLNSAFPSQYPDSNHRPLLCIPVGGFDLLAGFRPLKAIQTYVREVPELQVLLGSDRADSLSVRELFGRLMHADMCDVRLQVRLLSDRLREKDANDRTDEEELILTLVKDYPGDVGIFSVYFLNYIKISSVMRQSFVYIPPNEPYAYLLGDCIECSSVSDNVVRAGLSGKHKDVPTLLDMLTYRDDSLSELVKCGEHVQSNVFKYQPPLDDFVVYEVHGPVTEGLPLPQASILVCLHGAMVVELRPLDGTEGDSAGQERLVFGQTVFCRAGSRLLVHSVEDGSKILIATS